MKVKFNCDCEIEIVERLSRKGEPVYSTHTFQAGAETDFDLIDHPSTFVWNPTTGGHLIPDKKLWNVQFGDGTMGMALSREWFDIISED